MATFWEHIQICMLKSFDFSGRASRSQFLLFFLFLLIVNTAASTGFNQPDGGSTFRIGFYFGIGTDYSWWINIFTALFTLPFLSVTIRRCHDLGIAGEWVLGAIFLYFVLVVFILKSSPTQQTHQVLTTVGLILAFASLLYVAFAPSKPGENRFGPNPNDAPLPSVQDLQNTTGG